MDHAHRCLLHGSHRCDRKRHPADLVAFREIHADERHVCHRAQREAKDQARHEDNLARFAAVEAKLATIIKNGSGAARASYRARKGGP
jgi:hypothetical protein